MSFEKDKYEVIKKAIPKDVAGFCYQMCFIRRCFLSDVASFCIRFN